MKILRLLFFLGEWEKGAFFRKKCENREKKNLIAENAS